MARHYCGHRYRADCDFTFPATQVIFLAAQKTNPWRTGKVTASERSLSEATCKTLARPIKIGTCGFGLAKASYAHVFACVEIQHTFYQPPQIKTLERWRAEVPADFEFTIKAWQLITHDAKSPTYRRLRRKLSENRETGVRLL